MPPYLEIDRLTKRFGAATPLDGVSLACGEGEVLALLGPSGCGKTTLLNCIAGLLAPEGGAIRLAGRDLTGVPPEKRNIGMLFQHYALFPHLTVEKNIAYGLRARGWSRADTARRVAEMVELVGLQPLAGRLPSRLSGGEQQRVALARALAPRPSLLLLDEPLSALDARIRVELGRELIRLQRASRLTTVLVTHDQSEALSLADRLAVIRDGKVEQDGTPDEVYRRPDTRFCADFLGRMNFLALPELAGGRSVGIRYEHVKLATPVEAVLARPHTWVARVEKVSFLGSCHRFELLLADYATRLSADVAAPEAAWRESALVAVTLPPEHWWLDPEGRT